jgi:iron-regulated transporter 1
MERGANAVPLLQDPSPVALNDSGVRRRLLASHCITRLGTQAWLFIAPLVLIRFTPAQPLLGPGFWGMVTGLASTFLGPGLGRWADRTDRSDVVTRGVLLQFVAVAGATTVIMLARAGSGAQEEDGQDWAALLAFTAFSVLEKLGTVLSDVSVKREWVPQLFTDEELKATNSIMSQIDLTTEVVGPFLAGLLITGGEALLGDGSGSSFVASLVDATDFGFVATGLLNVLSFGPQLALLRRIYRSHSVHLQPAAPKDRKGPVPPEGAWGTWCGHPGGLQLLSGSYALLYLTVLSPHGALITAYLSDRRVTSTELSAMRGAGALVGILGTVCRDPLGRKLGDRVANSLSVCWLAAFMLAAMLSFQAAAGPSGAPQGLTMPLLVFMVAVCVGRPGLYAFELGVLNQEQELVDKRHTTAVGAVDQAILSLATMVMYGSGMYFSRPDQFALLVEGSAFFVGLGAATYIAWTVLYKAKRHRHAEDDHGHEDGHSHSHGHDLGDHYHHPHTTQMEALKEAHEDGGYMHEHIIYDPSVCIVQ